MKTPTATTTMGRSSTKHMTTSTSKTTSKPMTTTTISMATTSPSSHRADRMKAATNSK